jgi:prolyl oligopeptidase
MKLSLPLLTLVILASCTSDQQSKIALNYPETVQVDSVDNYFGTTVADPYRWLEDDMSDETAKWVNAQNQVTFSYLEAIPFRDKIKERLTQLLDYERVSAPFIRGEYEYFYKNDGLQNQSVLYRKKADELEPEVFLNPNSFSDDGTVSLAGTEFSKDGQLLVYMISIGGSDWRKALILDTDKMEVLEDTLHDLKFSGLSWRNRDGFYYSSYDRPKDGSVLSGKTQFHKLYYHKLGTPQSEDQLIFGGESQPYRYIFGNVSEDGNYLIVSAANYTSGGVVFARDLRNPDSDFVVIDDDMETEESVLLTNGDQIILETNKEAPNNRIVSVDFTSPDPVNWKDLIPETDNVLNASTAGGMIFANYLVDAKTEVHQYDINGKLIRKVELPDIGSAYGFSGKQSETHLYYTFTSFTYPSTIYRYDIKTGESTLHEMSKVDFNPEGYVTKQVFYTSKDGTRVPMFIVHKKGIELNGKNPTYLYAYGGFNISLRPSFSTTRLVWLENGGIYAQPNIRGGGEYGESWHEAGTKMNKQNVFDDFISAAEYLIEEGFTSSDYLAIAGGSNGGLLIGATMTQRPELAKVAFPAVGVLDMLRYHKFTAGAGWATDYGTSDDSEEMFQYLKGYSPLHNLKPGISYPATMVTTADHDDRVVPAHSYKFAATLQKHHVGNNPVLIRIETDAGHGAGTPITKTIEQWADRFSFAWYNMGFIPEYEKEEM